MFQAEVKHPARGNYGVYIKIDSILIRANEHTDTPETPELTNVQYCYTGPPMVGGLTHIKVHHPTELFFNHID
jgi:hypothetical protein